MAESMEKLEKLVEKIKNKEIGKGFIKIKINKNKEIDNISIEKDFKWKNKLDSLSLMIYYNVRDKLKGVNYGEKRFKYFFL